MRIIDLLENGKTRISFEFFPPKTAKGWDSLFNSISELMPLKPAYVSVTYGAGGSTRDRTHDLVKRIKTETPLEVVAHLTCVGATKEGLRDVLKGYSSVGVSNILALKGDMPDGNGLDSEAFPHAVDLVHFIKKEFPQMGIAVAGFPEGHPAMPNRLKEIDYLKAKVDAGADYIVTQLFFDNRDYYDFVERCTIAGINVPIIAGIMPIISRKSMERMAELAGGARYPAKLLKAVSRADDDESFYKIGVHWATQQALDLIYSNVSGIHFYTLNNSKASLEICQSMGLKDYSSL